MADDLSSNKCAWNCLNNARVNQRKPDRLDVGDAPLDLMVNGKRQGFAFTVVKDARDKQRTIGGQIVGANGTLFGGW